MDFDRLLSPIEGKVVLVDGSRLYRGIADRVEVSDDNGQTWKVFAKFQISFPVKILVRSHLASRLLRLGLHHFVATDDGCFYAIFNRKLYKLNQHGIVLSGPEKIQEGRPLCVAVQGNKLIYGAYSSNEKRQPMRLFSYDGDEHHTLYKFQGIRHIHGVFNDPYTAALYLTTGDYGDEAGIWKYSNGELTKIIGGGQQTRAVQLLFDEQYIYYSTDTPLEENHIYRISRSDYSVSLLAEVASSVFYGCKLGSYKFFSTVAEPSEVNTSDHIQLWGCLNEGAWVLLSNYKKDMLPMKYFQYGQLMFPHIKKEGEFLIFYKLGVTGSGRSYIIPLDALYKYFGKHS
ncbi:hypothetical protein [Kangiella sediminilitoris]|uniref:Uncharacterized protein n=1 Tax=Kangiella sediminilitoris TaxID=1144748 RepID=A0A1B3BBJ5_9GAMM|nr:hypothetical protein [Kangiella sediminilitoris]AOE50147.1 hypothetical protein KS2013_1435 [Kangiella sediminilitoris]